jgi:hypothetical protein
MVSTGVPALLLLYNVVQNKIDDFNFFLKNQNSTISLPVKWEVREKSTFLCLCLAKGAAGV